MREHEVPTHVQTEDRVLLWFTFQQLVAMTVIAALAYGAFRYAPVGSTGVRIGLAVILGLMGMALVVGKVGGRRLPLVVADLLKYRLSPRRWAGAPAQLVRPEPPAPVNSRPGSLTLMLKRVRQIARRRNARMPFRPHNWFGKGRRRRKKGPKNESKKTRRNRDWRSWLAVPVAVMAAAAGAVPLAALADDHHPDGLGFEITEPVLGRRIYVERLSVTGHGAEVTVRAAMAQDLWVRAYGGPGGEALKHRETSWLPEGLQKTYTLPLSGASPSLTFSWRDRLRQTGALSLKEGQLPYPLPTVEGELCDLELASLEWTPGWVEGTVESECADELVETVDLPVVTGHETVTVKAAMDADVTAVTGTITATAGGSNASVTFVPDGNTVFRVAVPPGEAVHGVSIEADLDAELRIGLPPQVGLAHQPERDERITQTVSLYRPGASRTVSETVTVFHGDGATTQHVISATLSVPGATVYRDVTVTVTHDEHVRAEVTPRAPMTRTRSEALRMTSSIGSDEPYEVLAVPEPEPEPEPATQTPGDMEELRKLFELLGWRWPW